MDLKCVILFMNLFIIIFKVSIFAELLFSLLKYQLLIELIFAYDFIWHESTKIVEERYVWLIQ